ncbi:DUF1569 domain-containing protein [Chitinophaga sp. G-6-1-13]|uniref:DUF1569 domain-containing protein n=1 Tax=Chitinophaga fulva TaxID=2728842 RepID=A0A848H0I9_9BACT|nr:DUF1569 domain-containing protein [Chitinophaga fulva]NML41338.1 DUF1569 domain-containing protein [Chitinophaga fulva]
MKTIFDPSTRTELINRINSLNEHSRAQWGKMDVWQMTKHCTIWFEWIMGKNNPTYKQEWLGRIFGKMALKSNTKDDRPMQKNMPAGKQAVKEKGGDVEQQKKIWINLIAACEHYSNPAFIHDFFGKMTTEQIGVFAYKHADHHLRQFGV